MLKPCGWGAYPNWNMVCTTNVSPLAAVGLLAPNSFIMSVRVWWAWLKCGFWCIRRGRWRTNWRQALKKKIIYSFIFKLNFTKNDTFSTRHENCKEIEHFIKSTIFHSQNLIVHNSFNLTSYRLNLERSHPLSKIPTKTWVEKHAKALEQPEPRPSRSQVWWKTFAEKLQGSSPEFTSSSRLSVSVRWRRRRRTQ